MAFNGSGVYTLPGPQLASGDTVSATENNQCRNDMAAAFNDVLCRDGQSVPTADLPMGGFKLTGLAAGAANGDSVRYEQVTSDVDITGGAIAGVTISTPDPITSTVATGTAPFVIASTTLVANLNADKLDGSDWAAPAAIGTTTPNAANFTDVNSESIVTSGLTKSVYYQETQVAIAAADIDLSLANYFSKTVSGNITFTVSNTPASGTVASFVLDLTNGGSYTITWWSGLQWTAGSPPVLTDGRDVLGFFTYDGGTTWTGLLLSRGVL